MNSHLRYMLIAWMAIMPFHAIIFAQEPGDMPDVAGAYTPVMPSTSQGLPILQIYVLEHVADSIVQIDSRQLVDAYKSISLDVGSTFNPLVTSMLVNRIRSDNRVEDAAYKLYSTAPGAPVIIVVDIYLKSSAGTLAHKEAKGMIKSKDFSEFPLLYQSDKSELTFILNGGAGLFDDFDAFFDHGTELNQGNPIATNPAGASSRFWGEMFLEPGIGGITELGNSGIYAYGAVTAMLSGRNASDIYTRGGGVYFDVEKAYVGLLFSGLGPHRDNAINVSYGRQLFQLNDGFLISQFSGSSNAGERVGVDLNPRTAFNKAGIIKWTRPGWNTELFYVEPQEMTHHNHIHTGYAGFYGGFNGLKNADFGLAFISRVRGEGDYALPPGSAESLPMKGLWAVNPKVWLLDICGTGIFFKSEYVHEWHSQGGMSANGWYAGLGIKLKKTPLKPQFYYRYAYMQGDNPETKIYSRFDPMLTGGLAEWVQGINMCKVVGHGNIASHRLQAVIMPSESLDVQLEYYNLRAPSLYNLGGAAALSNLKSHHLGDEITVMSHWYINHRFMLMGLVSVAFPGKGIKSALSGSSHPWSTFQLSLFMTM